MSGSYEPEPVRLKDLLAYREETGASLEEAKLILAREREAEAMIRLLTECEVSAAEQWLLMRHAEKEGYAPWVRDALAARLQGAIAGL